MNRLLTTMIQLILAGPIIYAVVLSIKERGR